MRNPLRMHPLSIFNEQTGRERPACSLKILSSFESVVFGSWERFAPSELVDELTAIVRLNRGCLA